MKKAIKALFICLAVLVGFIVSLHFLAQIPDITRTIDRSIGAMLAIGFVVVPVLWVGALWLRAISR